MKRAIILQHSPSTGVQGQLANQLWNFISVYAYARERSVPCYNYSFFEYNHFFDIKTGNTFVYLLFFLPFALLRHIIPEPILTPLWRKFYKLFVLCVKTLAPQTIISSGNSVEDGAYYLPPSQAVRSEFLKKEEIQNTLHFDGWLFRNPVGITRYREDIRNYFKPKKKIDKTVKNFIDPLRKKYNYLVGIHIRQGDYKTFKGGRYFIEQKRVREIIDAYTREHGLDLQQTAFIIASNGPIEEKEFEGLHSFISGHAAAEDLFILASCDVILGSDSSFGNFAAYWGNIPHIVFSRESMDWQYYLDKKTYFENKYCTLVHF